MGRPVYLVRARSPLATCIVNDAHLGREGVCGGAAAEGRECAAPVCVDHLCQHRHSNGQRCKNTPLRLVQGVLYTAAGLFPSTGASANCARHEGHNCIGFANGHGTVRCAGTKVPGRDHCPAHAAARCKWKHRDRRFCAQAALQGSRYCRGHCCAVDRCSEHVCAFQFLGGWPVDFPACTREPVEGQLLCDLHDRYVRCAGQGWWMV